MGELRNKVEGNVKKAAGRVTGDESMEARGEGQRVIGEAQEGTRKVKGKVEEAIGRVTGDKSTEAKGAARKA